MLRVADIHIPDDELNFQYARSSGAGGQHVNKVNSKVILRWNPDESNSLRPSAIARFKKIWAARLSTKGEVVLSSDRHRDQIRNREEVLSRLAEMIEKSLNPPKKRRPTKPSRSSIERRLKEKKQRAQQKKSRRNPTSD